MIFFVFYCGLTHRCSSWYRISRARGGLVNKVCTLLQWDPEARGVYFNRPPTWAPMAWPQLESACVDPGYQMQVSFPRTILSFMALELGCYSEWGEDIVWGITGQLPFAMRTHIPLSCVINKKIIHFNQESWVCLFFCYCPARSQLLMATSQMHRPKKSLTVFLPQDAKIPSEHPKN